MRRHARYDRDMSSDSATWGIRRARREVGWLRRARFGLGVGRLRRLVAAVGLLSSWDVMMKKPLGILRAE